jgi:hypothetical protein
LVDEIPNARVNLVNGLYIKHIVLKQGKRVDVLTETDQAIRQQHEV